MIFDVTTIAFAVQAKVALLSASLFAEACCSLTVLLITSLLALTPATSVEVVGNSGSNDGHGGWGYWLGHEPDSNQPCAHTSSASAPGPSDWGYGFHDSPDGRSGQFGYGYSSPDGRWSGGGGGAWSGGGDRDGSMVQGAGEKPYACSCDQTVLSLSGAPTISISKAALIVMKYEAI